jgi:hypothetical protein
MGDMADWAHDREEMEEFERRLRVRVPVPAGHWKTRAGEVIAFKDMEHSHLLNTIAMLERKLRELQDAFCDNALDIDLLFPAHAGLVAEAKRRGLVAKTAGKLDRMVTR